MKTVRRLLYADIVSSVVFVAFAFLSLFFFIDFVDELSAAVIPGYSALSAAAYGLLLMPGHLYELLPIAVLIGAIYALSRMAQSSEFTILRTGGLGPARALRLLTWLGLAFGVLTFVVGDYIAPMAEAQAAHWQAESRGNLNLGRSGAWLKDHSVTPQGERNYAINVGGVGAAGAAFGTLRDVRIFEFDTDGRLLRRVAAQQVRIEGKAPWALSNVKLTQWDAQNVTQSQLDKMPWPSTLSANVVAAAVLPLTTMSTLDLARYISHLADNEQAAQQYQIQFWKRALYPLACLVMMALALPFAYLQTRAGSISLKVFGGIMLGISFVLLNNVAGHLGVLRDWTPWIVASAPSALYLLFSLAAFGWLVRFR
jgi:lipopolysaccharide export system permease protein